MAKRCLSLVAGCVLLASPALADHPPTPSRGGRVIDSNGHRLELVTEAGKLSVRVTDLHNEAVAVGGWTGKATVLAPGGRVEVALVAGDAALEGRLPVGAELATTIVSLKIAGQPVVGRFAHLPAPAWRPDPSQVARGEVLYDSQCVMCHGDQRQGQPNWRLGEKDGTVPAPALDASGHAWRHADADLARTIRDGGVIMPGFAAVLSESEIADILSFLKAAWPLATLAQQPLTPTPSAPVPMPGADGHAGHH